MAFARKRSRYSSTTSRSLKLQRLSPRQVLAAGLAIDVTLNGQDAESPPGPILAPGSEIAWDFNVTNTGDRPITGLQLVHDGGTSTDLSDDVLADPVIIDADSSTLPQAGTLVANFTDLRVGKMVVDPAGSRLFATDLSSSIVTMFDTETSSIIGTIELGGQPHGLSLSPDGSRLYVTTYDADNQSGHVVVIDAVDMSLVSELDVAGQPWDVEVGADGRLIVLTNEALLSLDAFTGESLGDSVAVSHPQGELVISPNRDRLYLGSIGAGFAKLTQYDVTASPPSVVWQSPTGTATGSNGQDLAISHDGRFVSYASGNGQGGYRIARYDTQASGSNDLMSIGGYFETGAFPREVTYSPDDTLVYTVSRSGQVHSWDTESFENNEILAVAGEARELVVDRTGQYLYAAFDDELRVYETGRRVGIREGDSNVNGLFDPGETWLFTANDTALSGQVQVTATASGIDSAGPPVSLTAASYYSGETLSIDLVSRLGNVTVNPADPPLRAVGNDLRVRHSVSNFGSVGLTNIHLVSDQNGDLDDRYIGGDSDDDGILDVGETWIYEFQESAIAGLQSDLIRVTADDVDSITSIPIQSDSAVAYFGVDSHIEIQSRINGELATETPGNEIGVGDPVAIVYEVSNAGNVSFDALELSEDAGTLRVDDDLSPSRIEGDVNSNEELDPGETWLYLIDDVSVVGEHKRQLSLATVDVLGELLTVEADANYVGVGGNLDLIVTLIEPGNPTTHFPTGDALVPSGEVLRFQYLVTNTGTLPLSVPDLSDDGGTPDDPSDDLIPFRVSEDVGADGILSPGEIWDYRVSVVAALNTREHGSHVSAQPVDEFGELLVGVQSVTDSATLRYFGGLVDIEVSILGSGELAKPGRDYLRLAGTPVSWKYQVTNTGNVSADQINVEAMFTNETTDVWNAISLPHTTTTGLASRGVVMAEFDSVSVHQFLPHPTLPYVFASDTPNNRVLVFNTLTLGLEQAFELGNSPRGMALSPDATRLYVANEGSGSIGVLDVGNLKVLPSLTVPQAPVDVQVGNDGRIYVLGFNNLLVLHPESAESVEQALPVTAFGGELSMNADRTRLYYANANVSPASLYQFDLTTPSATLLWQSPSDGTSGANGQALALSKDGTRVAHAVGVQPSSQSGAGQGDVKIIVRNTSDMSVAGEYFLSSASPGVFAQEIAFDPDGLFAYATSQSGSIAVFGTSTFSQASSISVDGNATEMETDSTGRYLFASLGDQSVEDRMVIYSTGRASMTINQGDVNFDRRFDPGETWVYGSNSMVGLGQTDVVVETTVLAPYGGNVTRSEGSRFVGAELLTTNERIAGGIVQADADFSTSGSPSDSRFFVEGDELKLHDEAFLTIQDDGLELSIWADESQVSLERLFVFDVKSHNPWYNDSEPADVNRDGEVTALDALIVINYLQSDGSVTLDARPFDFPYRYDVTNDLQVTALDALRVINALNGLDGDSDLEPSEEPLATSPSDSVPSVWDWQNDRDRRSRWDRDAVDRILATF